MPNEYCLVLSDPGKSVSDDDYDAWYDMHVREIIALPGLAAANRFTARLMLTRDVEPPNYCYATRYDIEGDSDIAIETLREAGKTGLLTMPDWLRDITSSGWRLMAKAAPLETNPAPDQKGNS
jgi:hypothetical protein